MNGNKSSGVVGESLVAFLFVQFDCCHLVSLSFTQFYECVWVGAGEPVLSPVRVGVCVCIESLVLLANYITTLFSFTPTHPPSLTSSLSFYVCRYLFMLLPHMRTQTHMNAHAAQHQ